MWEALVAALLFAAALCLMTHFALRRRKRTKATFVGARHRRQPGIGQARMQAKEFASPATRAIPVQPSVNRHPPRAEAFLKTDPALPILTEASTPLTPRTIPDVEIVEGSSRAPEPAAVTSMPGTDDATTLVADDTPATAEAAFRSEAGNQQVVPPEDNWETGWLLGHVTEIPVTVEAYITYVDGKEQESKREIRTRSLCEHGEGFALLAFCHMRKAHRSFIVSRIKEFIDLSTGEIVADVVQHLQDIHSKSPRVVAQAGMQEFEAELAVLTYVGRADGRLTAREADAIRDYVLGENPALPSEEVHILCQLIEPSQTEFRKAVKLVKSLEKDRRTRFGTFLDRLEQARHRRDEFVSTAAAYVRKNVGFEAPAMPSKPAQSAVQTTTPSRSLDFSDGEKVLTDLYPEWFLALPIGALDLTPKLREALSESRSIADLQDLSVETLLAARGVGVGSIGKLRSRVSEAHVEMMGRRQAAEQNEDDAGGGMPHAGVGLLVAEQ